MPRLLILLTLPPDVTEQYRVQLDRKFPRVDIDVATTADKAAAALRPAGLRPCPGRACLEALAGEAFAGQDLRHSRHRCHRRGTGAEVQGAGHEGDWFHLGAASGPGVRPCASGERSAEGSAGGRPPR